MFFLKFYTIQTIVYGLLKYMVGWKLSKLNEENCVSSDFDPNLSPRRIIFSQNDLQKSNFWLRVSVVKCSTVQTICYGLLKYTMGLKLSELWWKSCLGQFQPTFAPSESRF